MSILVICKNLSIFPSGVVIPITGLVPKRTWATPCPFVGPTSKQTQHQHPSAHCTGQFQAVQPGLPTLWMLASDSTASHWSAERRLLSCFLYVFISPFYTSTSDRTPPTPTRRRPNPELYLGDLFDIGILNERLD